MYGKKCGTYSLVLTFLNKNTKQNVNVFFNWVTYPVVLTILNIIIISVRTKYNVYSLIELPTK